MSKIVTVERVVNDFELILGLDSLYRDSMKRHEVEYLLPLVMDIFCKLNIAIDEYPPEGYYYETEELKQYFNCVKTLKETPKSYEKQMGDFIGYNKIVELLNSGLYGNTENNDKYVLPTVKDPLYYAMEKISIENWNAKNIIDSAYTIIKDTNSCNIVGLGILSKSPILVTALRESTVLYSDFMVTGAPDFSIEYVYKYIWNVSKEIEDMANRIIEIFNGISLYKIPLAIEKNAEIYYEEFDSNPIDIRCVRIGCDLSDCNYHWLIKNKYDSTNGYDFIEFWDSKLWTTEDAKNDYYKRKELREIKWKE